MNSQENVSPVAAFHRDMLKINAGLHVLRQRFTKHTPDDFDWWFTFDNSEVIAGWSWKGDDRRRYQRDIRSVTLTELMERWGAVDWCWERECARSLTNESKAAAV